MAQAVLRDLDDLLAWTAQRKPGREARLRRFRALLDRYRERYPFPPCVVKLAGTNGKGSVAVLLESALVGEGHRVGLFLSPHLVAVDERIRIDGGDAPRDVLNRALRALVPLFEEAVRDGGDAGVPSHFEALILLALKAFADADVGVAVFEAGVGGAHDAVGLLDAATAAITSVALDHPELGSTLAEVAAEKAGIASPGSTLVVGPGVDAAVVDVIARRARGEGVTVRRAAVPAWKIRPLGWRGYRVTLDLGEARRRFRLPLAGPFQLHNLATVLETLRVLMESGVVRSLEAITAVSRTVWPGRLERVGGSPAWLLDVAHNGEALQALAHCLPELSAGERARGGRVVTLYGTSRRHLDGESLSALRRLATPVYVVEGFYQSLATAELRRQMAGGPQIDAELGSVQAAVDRLRTELDGEDDLILVTGSVYLVGKCRELLGLATPRPGARTTRWSTRDG